MKDLFARLGVSPEDDDAIESAIAPGAARTAELPADQLDALRDIIADPARREHMKRVDLQYRAMAAAIDALDDDEAVDTHRWRERLVEFER